MSLCILRKCQAQNPYITRKRFLESLVHEEVSSLLVRVKNALKAGPLGMSPHPSSSLRFVAGDAGRISSGSWSSSQVFECELK